MDFFCLRRVRNTPAEAGGVKSRRSASHGMQQNRNDTRCSARDETSAGDTWVAPSANVVLQRVSEHRHSRGKEMRPSIVFPVSCILQEQLEFSLEGLDARGGHDVFWEQVVYPRNAQNGALDAPRPDTSASCSFSFPGLRGSRAKNSLNCGGPCLSMVRCAVPKSAISRYDPRGARFRCSMAPCSPTPAESRTFSWIRSSHKAVSHAW